MKCRATIARVAPGSIAAKAGLVAGDRLLTVNGQTVQDIIDLSFALVDEKIRLLVEKGTGEQKVISIKKAYGCDLGIEFESAVFDQVRRCGNRCIFCFIDQMPPGMRETLYVKDDDYRLSFLYGNFITLTNITDQDIKRIINLHLSPLYISVHTTDGDLREKMLGNKRAGEIMIQLKELTANGIDLHTQIVLCPEINDGQVLEQTVDDLYSLHPSVLSAAIVPVGLTQYRTHCFPLQVFTSDKAKRLIETVSLWQQRFRQDCNQSFVYLADEFYLTADQPLPAYDLYDGFPQLENGVGIVRNFLTEWEQAELGAGNYDQPHYIDVVCGISAAKILQPLLAALQIVNLSIRVVAIPNKFFGPDVTVTGLLTGNDILTALKALPGPRTGIILPGVALRKGEAVFLDGTTPQFLADALKTPVKIAFSAQELRNILCNWRLLWAISV